MVQLVPYEWPKPFLTALAIEWGHLVRQNFRCVCAMENNFLVYFLMPGGNQFVLFFPRF